MRTAIVYYSMSGNTELAAKRAADAIGAELIRIQPVKAFPDKGFKKFLWGGKSAVMKETPELIPYLFNADEFDRVVISTPVWASNMTPPIRSFITDNLAALKEKRVAALVCCSGGGAEKAIERIRELIGISSLEAYAVLIDPKDKPSEQNEKALREFIDKLARE